MVPDVFEFVIVTTEEPSWFALVEETSGASNSIDLLKVNLSGWLKKLQVKLLARKIIRLMPSMIPMIHGSLLFFGS